MSSFGTRFTAAFPRLLSEFGQSVTYTPISTLSGITRSVIFQRGPDVEERGTATITCTTNATTGVAAPARGDTVTVNSVVWVVVGTEVDTDEGNAVLSCVTPEAVA